MREGTKHTATQVESVGSLSHVAQPTPPVETDKNSFNLSQRAKELARESKVSLRTAYRHLKRGTLPAADRRLGQDGKRYPAGRGGMVSPVLRELRLSLQALRRADRKACELGVSADELGILREIMRAASEIFGRWEAAV